MKDENPPPPLTGKDIASHGIPQGEPDEFVFTVGDQPSDFVRLSVQPTQIVAYPALHGLGKFFIRRKDGEIPVRMREEIVLEGRKSKADASLDGVDVSYLANYLLDHPEQRSFETVLANAGTWRLKVEGKETQWSGHSYRERAYSYVVTLWPELGGGLIESTFVLSSGISD